MITVQKGLAANLEALRRTSREQCDQEPTQAIRMLSHPTALVEYELEYEEGGQLVALRGDGDGHHVAEALVFVAAVRPEEAWIIAQVNGQGRAAGGLTPVSPLWWLTRLLIERSDPLADANGIGQLIQLVRGNDGAVSAQCAARYAAHVLVSCLAADRRLGTAPEQVAALVATSRMPLCDRRLRPVEE
jgi:hypothetical protein